jgi:signal transduction histidine kinase
MKSIYLHLVSQLIIALTSLSFAQSAPVLEINKASDEGFSLNAKMDLLEDVDGTLSLEQVMLSKDFKLAGQRTPNFGFSSSVYWVRFSLLNSTDRNQLLLELGYPLLDYVSLFSEDFAGGFTEKIGGDMLPFSERAREHRTITFELSQEPNTTAAYYLRIQTSSSLQIPLRVYTESSFGQMSSDENTMLGGYYGIFIVMILFNAFLWLSLKDRLYGYYIFFLSAYLLTQLVMNGNAHRYLLGDFPMVSNMLVPVSCFIVLWSITLFCRSFLDLATNDKKISDICIWIERLCLVLVLVSVVVPYSLAVKLVAFAAVLVPPGLIYAGIKRAINGYAPAKIYVLGWFSLLAGITIFSLKTVGLLPANIFTEYAMQVGSILEVTLLSLALADRINVIKEKDAVAQKVLLENYRVLAAEYSNREKIADQNSALKSEISAASEQLFQADKLATLGSLAAGVAHDIANPTGLIHASATLGLSNFRSFQLRLEQLLGNAGAESVQVFETFRADIQKGEKAISDILLGAKRIRSINEAIRNQSRADPNPADFNVKQLLDECITILDSKLRMIHVEVYCGDELKGWGRRSHIGQVVTNLLSNAIDAAVENKELNPKAKVSLVAKQIDSGIIFSVCDSGRGVPCELREKILQPFYTTKGLGKGTGLGMPICVRILEEHACKLAIGEAANLGGANFSFALPYSPVRRRLK